MNDRHGMQKWFYADLLSGAKLFAPDVISFRAYPSLRLTEDKDALVTKFKYDCILENKTFYNEVKRIPIASYFQYCNNTWQLTDYWKPENVENRNKLDTKDFIDKATSLFFKIVPEYVSDGQTGMSLTGGWDTRCIVAILAKLGISLPSYTFTGCYKESFDVKIAKKVAHSLHWSHEKLFLGKDFLKDINTWIEKASICSDGLSNLNTCHEYYLNVLARNIGFVRLTGKYGSQVIRGVTMLKNRAPNPNIFSHDFNQLVMTSQETQKTTSRSSLLRWELPLLESVKQSQEFATLYVRTPYMDNSLVDLMLVAPDMEDKALLQKTIINTYNPTLAKIVTNRGEYANNSFHFGTKSYYKTMNFLDMVYNWERLPKVARMGSYILDMVGLSSIILGNKEWIHYRKWIEKELRNYVLSILLDEKTLSRSIFNRTFIEKIAKEHFSVLGNNYTCEIDKIIGYEIWHRLNEE